MIRVVLIVRASGVLLFLIKGFNLNKIRTDVGLFLTVCSGVRCCCGGVCCCDDFCCSVCCCGVLCSCEVSCCLL